MASFFFLFCLGKPSTHTHTHMTSQDITELVPAFLSLLFVSDCYMLIPNAGNIAQEVVNITDPGTCYLLFRPSIVSHIPVLNLVQINLVIEITALDLTLFHCVTIGNAP